MRKLGNVSLIAIVTLLLFSGMAALTASHATSSGSPQHAPATCTQSWNVVANPNPSTSYNSFTAVTAMSSSDVWAVGYYSSTGIYQTLTEHWDGAIWSVVTSPNVGTSGDSLTAVSAISPSDVWVVGTYPDTSDIVQTLTEHWNGSNWSVVVSPNVGTYYNYINGVSAISSNDVWAVGEYYNSSGNYQTLTEHWDGAIWSVVTSPNVGTSGNYLTAVSAISPSNVWVVGDYIDTSGNPQTLSEHWDGSSWSVVTSPNVGTTDNELHGVTAISSSDVWTVGSYYNGTFNQTLTEHWNGSSWSVVPTPSPGPTNSYLLGVSAISSNDVWAVGDNGSVGSSSTLVEHWNGNSWIAVPNPNPGASYNYLSGVTAISSNDVWAVGDNGSGGPTYTLVEHYSASGCPTNTPATLTNTPLPPTATLTPGGPTNTPASPTATRINTPLPATNTPASATNTPGSNPCLGSNLLVNGGFDTGSFAPWVISDTNPSAVVTTTQHQNGSYSAVLGSNTAPEPLGDSSIYQTVAVPAGRAQLSYWYFPLTTDTIEFDWQDVYVENSSGAILATLMHVAEDDRTWKYQTLDLTPFAGQTVRIVILVHQDGFLDFAQIYLDNVAVQDSSTCGFPTATPVPPTATPADCANPFVDINGNVFYGAIHYLNCRGVINGTDPTHYSPAGTSTRGQFAKVVVLGFGEQLYTPPGGAQDFTDVLPSYFAYAFIETGFHNGILSGFDPVGCAAHNAAYPCYLPNIPITRGQLTKLVVGAAHYPAFTPTGGGRTFSDVLPSNVFFVSIETAHYKGVINGYPDGTFRPNNNIRRDEMAQIVYKGVTTP